jgi:Glyoxalase-like domain
MKNRMHLDLWGDDVEAEAARLTVLGAKRLRDQPFAEHGLRWIQLADPEGQRVLRRPQLKRRARWTTTMRRRVT